MLDEFVKEASLEVFWADFLHFSIESFEYIVVCVSEDIFGCCEVLEQESQVCLSGG